MLCHRSAGFSSCSFCFEPFSGYQWAAIQLRLTEKRPHEMDAVGLCLHGPAGFLRSVCILAAKLCQSIAKCFDDFNQYFGFFCNDHSHGFDHSPSGACALPYLVRHRLYEKALEYYMLALVRGDDLAFAAIGHMYEYGEGVKKDLKKAISYYQQGAEKKEENCMEALRRLNNEQ